MLIGRKSLSVLKTPIMYPIYLALFVFISNFALIGSQRANFGSGQARLTYLQNASKELEKDNVDLDDESTFLSRFSSLNQLSQVKKVADEDGYYYGETMSYLAFGFIPRFIWPEKPLIQQGAWFAYRIGMARIINGKYSNSIDMTPAGEFYLNFGWIGVIIGCYLLGFFFCSLWKTTDFWNSEENLLGSFFGFYLLFMGLFSFGADLQVVLTLIAIYLSCLAFNKLIGKGKLAVSKV
jgi:hypothetical protein